MSLVVFFKQKTAYEMRISDWSSDVCSSDLPSTPRGRPCPSGRPSRTRRRCGGGRWSWQPPSVAPRRIGAVEQPELRFPAILAVAVVAPVEQIGSSSCRERVWQYG